MPHFVGNFLSERMYDNALGTKHPIGSNICCRFVDVTSSRQERGEDGKSWIVSEYFSFFCFILILIPFRTARRQGQSLRFAESIRQTERNIEVKYLFC